MNQDDKIIVGSEEWCSFPELGVPAVKARVDSGAKTSSLHAYDIQKFTKNDETWVRFEVHPLQKNLRTTIACEAPIVDRRRVKSSSGESEKRYVIKTLMRAGDESFEVELTLTNRDSMGYRMLLGREAMKGRMLVDPDASFCLGECSEETLERYYPVDPGAANSGLKIGLLASNPKLYSNRRIMEAAEDRGHQIEFYNVKQCYMKLDAVSPEVHYRGGLVISDLDAIITRIRPDLTFYGCALTRQFESMGVYTTNSSEAISQSRDRLFSLQQLLKAGINIPTTGFANSPIDTSDLIELVDGAPLIVKLLEGTQGRGVVLAETNKASESVINAFKTLNADLLVQKFIEEAEGKDLRCFVIDGKVAAAVERTPAPGEFIASARKGDNAKLIKITPEERKLAVLAAKTLGLKVAGVDIIRSKKGPLLLEVNSTPALEGIETATGKDIAGLIIRSVEKKLHWQSHG